MAFEAIKIVEEVIEQVIQDNAVRIGRLSGQDTEAHKKLVRQSANLGVIRDKIVHRIQRECIELDEPYIDELVAGLIV